jgi:hypothetical protein
MQVSVESTKSNAIDSDLIQLKLLISLDDTSNTRLEKIEQIVRAAIKKDKNTCASEKNMSTNRLRNSSLKANKSTMNTSIETFEIIVDYLLTREGSNANFKFLEALRAILNLIRVMKKYIILEVFLYIFF